VNGQVRGAGQCSVGPAPLAFPGAEADEQGGTGYRGHLLRGTSVGVTAVGRERAPQQPGVVFACVADESIVSSPPDMSGLGRHARHVEADVSPRPSSSCASSCSPLEHGQVRCVSGPPCRELPSRSDPRRVSRRRHARSRRSFCEDGCARMCRPARDAVVARAHRVSAIRERSTDVPSHAWYLTEVRGSAPGGRCAGGSSCAYRRAPVASWRWPDAPRPATGTTPRR
jgi:hypothetical protein